MFFVYCILVVWVTTLDYYKCCEVQFKGLPNIHAVQKSFVMLRSLISEGDPNRFHYYIALLVSCGHTLYSFILGQKRSDNHCPM